MRLTVRVFETAVDCYDDSPSLVIHDVAEYRVYDGTYAITKHSGDTVYLPTTLIITSEEVK